MMFVLSCNLYIYKSTMETTAEMKSISALLYNQSKRNTFICIDIVNLLSEDIYHRKFDRLWEQFVCTLHKRFYSFRFNCNKSIDHMKLDIYSGTLCVCRLNKTSAIKKFINYELNNITDIYIYDILGNRYSAMTYNYILFLLHDIKNFQSELQQNGINVW
jgi:hypothetical protein